MKAGQRTSPLGRLGIAGAMAFYLVLASIGNLFSTEQAWAEPVKKWRIAYVEGGNFTDYGQILLGTIRGLELLGLVPGQASMVPEKATVREIWAKAAAATKNQDNYPIEFLEDGFYSSNWNEDLRRANKEAIYNRIRTKNDIDLIFAFGTAAGVDMVSDEHSVAVMNFSTTDPIAAGISQSVHDSGRDNVHAKLEPGRYTRQLNIFHDVIPFQKLGICYGDTPRDMEQAALAEIEVAAERENFELVRGIMTDLGEDDEANFQKRLACHEQIAQEADAVYLTFGLGIDTKRMEKMLQPFIKAKIPTFAQAGPSMVELGALLSMAQADFDEMGLFEAKVVQSIVNGAKPREISQVYQSKVDLALNLRMAVAIGWNPPFDLLAAVDELYQEIKNAE